MVTAGRFLEHYVDELRDGNAAVFAGAGLSIPAGLVDWRSLLRDIAADIRLDVDRETDLISVAQFHVNDRNGRHRINSALVTEFAERAALTPNHHLLAALPIRTYWTTNYDTLIEHALRAANKRVDVKYADANLPVTLRKRDATLYKMHGDVSRPDEAVVTRDDYELYPFTHPLMTAALQGDLVSKTFLFVGFSFSDPNLSYVLSRIRVLLKENRRDHYCLLRRVHEGDFEKKEDFEYAAIQQEHQVRDLSRYGIQAILCSEYSDYTALLEKVTQRFRRRRIFVSGSAASFAPRSDTEGNALVSTLGRTLVEAGFDVVSGFGFGIGPVLLNGALEGLSDTGSRAVDDRLLMQPFPASGDGADNSATWSAYRRRMVAEAGIALFIFGNKSAHDGAIDISPGVMEEFEIARSLGLQVIALSSTGYAAAAIGARILVELEHPDAPPPVWLEDMRALMAEEEVEPMMEKLVQVLNLILRD